MTNVEVREIVEREIKERVNPLLLIIWGALNTAAIIALLLFSRSLWNTGETNDAWLTAISGDVKALKSVNQLARELDDQQELMERILIAVTKEKDDAVIPTTPAESTD